ncbi:MAG: hypothetical protein LBI34_01065 [Puniceicoccales bacterium]|jgi:hypothetical protein|nr:hypothetical protein [Puniceicoccales bacterium]
MADERLDYNRIVKTLHDGELCRHGLELFRAMSPIEREITMEHIALHVTSTLLKGNELLGVIAALYRNPTCRQYKDMLDLLSAISLAVVRREAPHVAATKAILCEDERNRIIAARERQLAADRKERLALIGVFGGTVSAGYAGYEAAIGSFAGPGGTLVGAVIGGAIGMTVGIIFGATKS